MNAIVMPDLITRRPTPTLEAALEGLRAMGIALERVDVVPIGPIEGYKGPIVDQKPKPGDEVEPRDRVILFVREAGLADRLPHGVLEAAGDPRDAADRMIELGKHDYWAQYINDFTPGRRFVLAMDRELGTLAAASACHRAGLRPIGGDANFAQALVGLFDLAELDLSDDEASLLATRLFEWPDRKGPLDALLDLMQTLLGLRANARELPGEWLDIPTERRTALGDPRARLGEGLSMGARFRSSSPTLRIELGPVGVRRFHRLDRDPQWHARVETLCRLCLPAGQAFDVKLLLNESDRKARLGDGMYGRLGRTTSLA